MTDPLALTAETCQTNVLSGTTLASTSAGKVAVGDSTVADHTGVRSTSLSETWYLTAPFTATHSSRDGADETNPIGPTTVTRAERRTSSPPDTFGAPPGVVRPGAQRNNPTRIAAIATEAGAITRIVQSDFHQEVVLGTGEF